MLVIYLPKVEVASSNLVSRSNNIQQLHVVVGIEPLALTKSDGRGRGFLRFRAFDINRHPFPVTIREICPQFLNGKKVLPQVVQNLLSFIHQSLTVVPICPVDHVLIAVVSTDE